MAPNPKEHSNVDDDNHSDAKSTSYSTMKQTQKSSSRARNRVVRLSSSKRGNDIRHYIPPYLRQFVQPYHGDFCYSPMFHPILIGQLMVEGFLTIACQDFLLPKLHEQRCVIDLTNSGEALHISKSTKKKAGRFDFTINQAFEKVVKGCHEQHGHSCWLYRPLVQAFQVIHQQTISNPSGFPTKLVDESQKQPRICNLRLYSIEVWNRDTGELAGGELGYSVGSIYTSLTGFSAEDSAGSVQLAALGSLLCQQGFTLWDLGMEMGYKNRLGAKLMPRDDFVYAVRTARESCGHISLKLSDENKVNCKDIIRDGKSKLLTDGTNDHSQQKSNKHPPTPVDAKAQGASPIKKARSTNSMS